PLATRRGRDLVHRAAADRAGGLFFRDVATAPLVGELVAALEEDPVRLAGPIGVARAHPHEEPLPAEALAVELEFEAALLEAGARGIWAPRLRREGGRYPRRREAW